MVPRLIRIEKIAKQLIRVSNIVFILFFISVGSMPTNAEWLRLVFIVFGLLTVVLLLMHYKTPKSGIYGAVLAFVFYLSIGLVKFFQASAMEQWGLVFAGTLVLLCSALLMFGDSVKEMIRERMIKPFPQQ